MVAEKVNELTGRNGSQYQATLQEKKTHPLSGKEKIHSFVTQQLVAWALPLDVQID